ncbi:MAG: tRNA-intron lyase [Candidatus Micrarchaeota archaeon]|nr:tRNA-intron lyase [Candidatus Micrarchaeota archaeon]
MLELEMHGKGAITATDASTVDILKRGFYGTPENHSLKLTVEEALYLIDMRNAVCRYSSKEIGFSDLAARFSDSNKFMARYFTYKDWRDRGLTAIPAEQDYAKNHQPQAKGYPASSLRLPKRKLSGNLFKNDLVAVLDDAKDGRMLYEKFWIGQYGSYKAADRGSLNKLDVFETLLLMDKGILALQNATRAELAKLATGRREDFMSLYGVYRDWREKGYVVKTGFKFGTHFRVYFPGARPMEASKGQTHSEHVIQVFPKDSKLLISEWARAIRVAHSVRKTLILAVPGKTSPGMQNIDFVLYHRHGGEADAPGRNPPKFAMLSLSEEEYIGGQEFSRAIEESKKMGLELLLAIADRETAVTYYRVRQIKLPGSKHDYFEIDWMQP